MMHACAPHDRPLERPLRQLAAECHETIDLLRQEAQSGQTAPLTGQSIAQHIEQLQIRAEHCESLLSRHLTRLQARLAGLQRRGRHFDERYPLLASAVNAATAMAGSPEIQSPSIHPTPLLQSSSLMGSLRVGQSGGSPVMSHTTPTGQTPHIGFVATPPLRSVHIVPRSPSVTQAPVVGRNNNNNGSSPGYFVASQSRSPPQPRPMRWFTARSGEGGTTVSSHNNAAESVDDDDDDVDSDEDEYDAEEDATMRETWAGLSVMSTVNRVCSREVRNYLQQQISRRNDEDEDNEQEEENKTNCDARGKSSHIRTTAMPIYDMGDSDSSAEDRVTTTAAATRASQRSPLFTNNVDEQRTGVRQARSGSFNATNNSSRGSTGGVRQTRPAGSNGNTPSGATQPSRPSAPVRVAQRRSAHLTSHNRTPNRPQSLSAAASATLAHGASARVASRTKATQKVNASAEVMAGQEAVYQPSAEVQLLRGPRASLQSTVDALVLRQLQYDGIDLTAAMRAELGDTGTSDIAAAEDATHIASPPAAATHRTQIFRELRRGVFTCATVDQTAQIKANEHDDNEEEEGEEDVKEGSSSVTAPRAVRDLVQQTFPQTYDWLQGVLRGLTALDDAEDEERGVVREAAAAVSSSLSPASEEKDNDADGSATRQPVTETAADNEDAMRGQPVADTVAEPVLSHALVSQSPPPLSPRTHGLSAPRGLYTRPRHEQVPQRSPARAAARHTEEEEEEGNERTNVSVTVSPHPGAESERTTTTSQTEALYSEHSQAVYDEDDDEDANAEGEVSVTVGSSNTQRSSDDDEAAAATSSSTTTTTTAETHSSSNSNTSSTSSSTAHQHRLSYAAQHSEATSRETSEGPERYGQGAESNSATSEEPSEEEGEEVHEEEEEEEEQDVVEEEEEEEEGGLVSRAEYAVVQAMYRSLAENQWGSRNTEATPELSTRPARRSHHSSQQQQQRRQPRRSHGNEHHRHHHRHHHHHSHRQHHQHSSTTHSHHDKSPSISRACLSVDDERAQRGRLRAEVRHRAELLLSDLGMLCVLQELTRIVDRHRRMLTGDEMSSSDRASAAPLHALAVRTAALTEVLRFVQAVQQDAWVEQRRQLELAATSNAFRHSHHHNHANGSPHHRHTRDTDAAHKGEEEDKGMALPSIPETRLLLSYRHVASFLGYFPLLWSLTTAESDEAARDDTTATATRQVGSNHSNGTTLNENEPNSPNPRPSEHANRINDHEEETTAALPLSLTQPSTLRHFLHCVTPFLFVWQPSRQASVGESDAGLRALSAGATTLQDTTTTEKATTAPLDMELAPWVWQESVCAALQDDMARLFHLYEVCVPALRGADVSRGSRETIAKWCVRRRQEQRRHAENSRTLGMSTHYMSNNDDVEGCGCPDNALARLVYPLSEPMLHELELCERQGLLPCEPIPASPRRTGPRLSASARSRPRRRTNVATGTIPDERGRVFALPPVVVLNASRNTDEAQQQQSQSPLSVDERVRQRGWLTSGDVAQATASIWDDRQLMENAVVVSNIMSAVLDNMTRSRQEAGTNTPAANSANRRRFISGHEPRPYAASATTSPGSTTSQTDHPTRRSASEPEEPPRPPDAALTLEMPHALTVLEQRDGQKRQGSQLAGTLLMDAMSALTRTRKEARTRHHAEGQQEMTGTHGGGTNASRAAFVLWNELTGYVTLLWRPMFCTTMCYCPISRRRCLDPLVCGAVVKDDHWPTTNTLTSAASSDVPQSASSVPAYTASTATMTSNAGNSVRRAMMSPVGASGVALGIPPPPPPSASSSSSAAASVVVPTIYRSNVVELYGERAALMHGVTAVPTMGPHFGRARNPVDEAALRRQYELTRYLRATSMEAMAMASGATGPASAGSGSGNVPTLAVGRPGATTLTSAAAAMAVAAANNNSGSSANNSSSRGGSPSNMTMPFALNQLTSNLYASPAANREQNFNPPDLLSCGHVISHRTLRSICASQRQDDNVFCPYCRKPTQIRSVLTLSYIC